MLFLRDAVANDAPLILRFVQGLAAYEGRKPEEVEATVEMLRQDGFGPNPKFSCVIAEWQEKPAGFALYFRRYSARIGKASLHVENLFVAAEYRRLGIGKALLVEVAGKAIVERMDSVVWQVLATNQAGIDFYTGIGAEKKSPRFDMSISGDALERFARS